MSDGFLPFIRDFTVDFFGSFLPGAFLMLAIYVGVIYPLAIDLPCGKPNSEALSAICKIIGSAHNLTSNTFGAFLGCVIAYLIGLSYSKMSVDWADSASFYYNSMVRSVPDNEPFVPGFEEGIAEEPSVPCDDPFDPSLEIETHLPSTTLWAQFCADIIPKFKADTYRSNSAGKVTRLTVLRSQIGVYLRFKLVYSLLFSFGIPVGGLPRIMFPYNNLRHYFRSIGLDAAASSVRWKGTPHSMKERLRNGMSHDHFNALKMRMQMAYPNQYHAIAYLEGQNRLLASMFFAASQAWVLICTFVTIVIICAVYSAVYRLIVERLIVEPEAVQYNSRPAIALSLVVALSLCLFRHRILVVLHKERVREVVRVIDSATFLGSFDNSGVWMPRPMAAAAKADDTFAV